MRSERQEKFHRSVLAAWLRQGFKSYRQAEAATGINYTALYNMHGLGRVPSRSKVIEWAEGIGEPINKWLELAGYDPIPAELVEKPGTKTSTIRVAQIDGMEVYLRMGKNAEVDKDIIRAIRELVNRLDVEDKPGKKS